MKQRTKPVSAALSCCGIIWNWLLVMCLICLVCQCLLGAWLKQNHPIPSGNQHPSNKICSLACRILFSPCGASRKSAPGVTCAVLLPQQSQLLFVVTSDLSPVPGGTENLGGLVVGGRYVLDLSGEKEMSVPGWLCCHSPISILRAGSLYIIMKYWNTKWTAAKFSLVRFITLILEGNIGGFKLIPDYHIHRGLGTAWVLTAAF